MFTNDLFHYTNTREDMNSNITSECTQYVLSEGYAGVKTGHIKNSEITSLLNSKEE